MAVWCVALSHAATAASTCEVNEATQDGIPYTIEGTVGAVWWGTESDAKLPGGTMEITDACSVTEVTVTSKSQLCPEGSYATVTGVSAYTQPDCPWFPGLDAQTVVCR